MKDVEEKRFVNIYNKKPKEKNPLEGTQWGGHLIVKKKSFKKDTIRWPFNCKNK
jgi:hypothetical protein